MKHHEVFSKLYLILQVGITMLTPILICFAAGYLIDRHFGTSLLAFFIIMGILSGYRAVYSLLKSHIKESEKKDEPDKEWIKKAFEETESDPKK
jgi:F0F1-type ATP synthase assembly protein I